MIDVDYAPLSKSLLKPLMPLAPLLKELKEMKLHVGLATNDSHYSACNHLNHLGVFDLFDEVIAADTVQTPKPSGDMIRRLPHRCVSPSEIAMVGTMPTTWKKRNGGAGLASRFSQVTRAIDITHLADHTLHDVAELPAL
jgi:phosphoglycolate phosphatase-like HAD superfamily hydrolase